MPFPCRAHAVPLPCRAAKGLRMCLSHLIYTVRPCLIHIFHAMSLPFSDNAIHLKTTAQHGRLSTNQTRPHCVNQMGNTYSKPLAARHGRGKAWVRHGNGMLCVNRPLEAWSDLIRISPILVAVWAKVWVCGRSFTGIVGSNPAGSTDVCLLRVLRVVRYRCLRRAGYSNRGILPNWCVQREGS